MSLNRTFELPFTGKTLSSGLELLWPLAFTVESKLIALRAFVQTPPCSGSLVVRIQKESGANPTNYVEATIEQGKAKSTSMSGRGTLSLSAGGEVYVRIVSAGGAEGLSLIVGYDTPGTTQERFLKNWFQTTLANSTVYGLTPIGVHQPVTFTGMRARIETAPGFQQLMVTVPQDQDGVAISPASIMLVLSTGEYWDAETIAIPIPIPANGKMGWQSSSNVGTGADAMVSMEFQPTRNQDLWDNEPQDEDDIASTTRPTIAEMNPLNGVNIDEMGPPLTAHTQASSPTTSYAAGAAPSTSFSTPSAPSTTYSAGSSPSTTWS